MNLAHKISSFYYQRALHQFIGNAQDMREIQLAKKKQYQSLHLQDFLKDRPFTRYADYESAWEKERPHSTHSWIPTSGSTAKRKWIPYPKALVTELNQAIDVFFGDIYQQFPQISKGTHYWSLSWLPTELRGEMTNDDSQLLTFWKRQLYKNTCPTPRAVEWAATSEEAWETLISYLVSKKDLTFASIWSPTYWIEVSRSISTDWDRWSHLRPEIKEHPLSDSLLFFQKLWPNLSVISCWDSGPSENFVKELQTLFPNVRIHGKGLWATEAAVTLPVQERKLLAYHAHAFDFLCLETQKVFSPWELEPGQRVSPLLTTGSGLQRYLLGDQLIVKEFWNHLPDFEFMGRMHTSDLVGEKIDQSVASEALSLFEALFDNAGIRAFPTSLVANGPQRLYELVALTKEVNFNTEMLNRKLDQLLSQNHHYQLARDLSQLKPARVRFFRSHEEMVQEYSPDGIKGQVKVQDLMTFQ